MKKFKAGGAVKGSKPKARKAAPKFDTDNDGMKCGGRVKKMAVGGPLGAGGAAPPEGGFGSPATPIAGYGALAPTGGGAPRSTGFPAAPMSGGRPSPNMNAMRHANDRAKFKRGQSGSLGLGSGGMPMNPDAQINWGIRESGGIGDIAPNGNIGVGGMTSDPALGSTGIAGPLVGTPSPTTMPVTTKTYKKGGRVKGGCK